MMIKGAMKEIESLEFDARVNIASSFEHFLRIIRDELAVKEAFDNLDSRNNITGLYSRIIELSKSSSDIRYENSWDVAIAVYLWLISLKDTELAKMASHVVSSVQQCWWASKMSYSLLRETTFQNESGEISNELAVRSAGEVSPVKMVNVGESLVLASYAFMGDEPSEVWVDVVYGHEIKNSGTIQRWNWDKDNPFFFYKTGGRVGVLAGE